MKNNPSAVCVGFIFGLFILVTHSPFVLAQENSNEQHLARIAAMKNSPKGPFNRIRWFCQDGSILAPVPYACKEHGGGRQHGEWSEDTRLLHTAGYPVATVYAALNENDFERLALDSDQLAFLVLERFMIALDDGWIFRQAATYRGALQVESEIYNAEQLLRYLVEKPQWQNNYYLLLREAVRLLPQDDSQDGFIETRALASELADLSPDFVTLRNKIHNKPDRRDADRIARFVERQTDVEIIEKANILQQKLAEAFVLPDWRAQLKKLIPLLPENLKEEYQKVSDEQPTSTDAQIAQIADLMASLRTSLSQFTGARAKLLSLRLSNTLEQTAFVLYSRLDIRRDDTRLQRLQLINQTNAILYGMGLLSPRQWQIMQTRMSLLTLEKTSLTQYKARLDYLASVAGWSSANLHLQFATAVEKLRQIEPLAIYYYDDRLRTSVLLYATAELDALIKDANQMSGLTHVFFGQKVGHGLRRLNPGFSRGKLTLEPKSGSIKRDQVLLVSETTEDLPPVAGVLTAKEGNALSHVQLLARNLGIPNAVISEQLMVSLSPHDQQTIILATSRGGVVHILANDTKWDDYFIRQTLPDDIQIKPDLKKLNLKYRRMTDLNELKSNDSGRIVGPKAANLGQLKSLFPSAVTEGIGLPFGLFKYYLDKPYKNTGQSTYQWMLQNYARLKALDKDGDEQQVEISAFLAALRDRIQSFELEPEFLAELKERLEPIVNDSHPGIFIRSDTNVEDLAGFTGAGLNLTLPNVIGFDNVANGIKAVWASPFTERAYAWRQRHMANPEHVYTAVLLLRSVNSSQSGVMVTTDLNTGDHRFLTIAANEGIGGAVDNQAAETLLVERSSGLVTLLQPASASKRRQLSAKGGLEILPVSRNDAVLSSVAISKLVDLTEQIAKKYPQFVDEQGKVEPVDIEFGFVDDELVLFQIRPFLQNPNALKNEYLQQMDQHLREQTGVTVDLTGQLSYE